MKQFDVEKAIEEIGNQIKYRHMGLQDKITYSDIFAILKSGIVEPEEVPAPECFEKIGWRFVNGVLTSPDSMAKSLEEKKVKNVIKYEEERCPNCNKTLYINESAPLPINTFKKDTIEIDRENMRLFVEYFGNAVVGKWSGAEKYIEHFKQALNRL